MKQTPYLRRGLLAALLLPVALLATAASTHAALITWSAPTTISGDGDVSTTGTLVGAFNLGGTGVASPTVNTVPFSGLVTSGTSVTSGDFNLAATALSSDNFTGATFAPFASLSAPYRSLLGDAGTSTGPPLTLTISSLSVGVSYQFQFWTNFSGFIDVLTLTTATAGASVTLHPQISAGAGPLGEGGLGQFAIGTFLADAPTQTITFTSDNSFFGPLINGFQLRQTAVAPAAVPEPGTALAGVALLGLCGLRRRR
jgi:hypothetical protein